MTQLRGNSMRYEDHVGMLHVLSKRALGALSKTPIVIEYEDVFGMMQLSFVKAQQTFDPTAGFTFSAYYGRSCWNNFLKWMGREVERTSAIGTVSVEELKSHEDEGDANVWDAIADGRGLSPEDIVLGRREVSEKLRGLSRDAKIVVRELLQPSETVKKALDAHNEAVASGQVSGRQITDLSVTFICKTLGMNRNRATDIRRELNKNFSVGF